jgi:hypothetical protein
VEQRAPLDPPTKVGRDAGSRWTIETIERMAGMVQDWRGAAGTIGSTNQGRLELHRAMLTAVITVSEEDDNRAVSICHAKCSTFFLTWG